MDSEKKSKFENLMEYSRTIVIVGAMLLVVLSLSLIAYKIYKAQGVKKNIEEEIVIEQPKQHHEKPVEEVVKNADSISAVKLAQLFVKYYAVDTVPKKCPAFLQEAFMGFEFGDFIYFEKIDLSNVASSTKIDSLQKDEVLFLGHYYKALSFLHKNNLPEAITNFNWLLNTPAKEPWATKINWYLAMTHLKTNSLSLVKGLLQKVEQSNTVGYSSKAASLLNDIALLNLPEQ